MLQNHRIECFPNFNLGRKWARYEWSRIGVETSILVNPPDLHSYLAIYIKLVGGFNPSENISQLGLLFPTYGKIKNVPIQQPANNRGSHHLNFTIHAMIIFSNPVLEKWSQLPIISPLLLVVSSFMLKVHLFNVFHGQSLCCMVKPSFFSMCDG